MVVKVNPLGSPAHGDELEVGLLVRCSVGVCFERLRPPLGLPWGLLWPFVGLLLFGPAETVQLPRKPVDWSMSQKSLPFSPNFSFCGFQSLQQLCLILFIQKESPVAVFPH